MDLCTMYFWLYGQNYHSSIWYLHIQLVRSNLPSLLGGAKCSYVATYLLHMYHALHLIMSCQWKIRMKNFRHNVCFSQWWVFVHIHTVQLKCNLVRTYIFHLLQMPACVYKLTHPPNDNWDSWGHEFLSSSSRFFHSTLV